MPICVERAVELSRAAAAVLEEEQVPLPQALGGPFAVRFLHPFPSRLLTALPWTAMRFVPLISCRRWRRCRLCCVWLKRCVPGRCRAIRWHRDRRCGS